MFLRVIIVFPAFAVDAPGASLKTLMQMQRAVHGEPPASSCLPTCRSRRRSLHCDDVHGRSKGWAELEYLHGRRGQRDRPLLVTLLLVIASRSICRSAIA